MEFLNLRIVNFLTIGDSGDLGLTGKGLVLIQGKNEDDPSASSNGAGKSSIPDALCWALYGVTARGETGDAVVNSNAKKDCMVCVVLRDGDSVYNVQRYRKHKDFKNTTRVVVWNPASGYPLTHPVDMTRGTEKETQDLIEQIMGCSLDVFKAAIYSGQEDMPDLPKMTDKQLKMLVEQAAGIERLERAYELARLKENDIKGKVTWAQSQVTALESRLVGAKAMLFDQERKRDEFEAGRKERQAGHQRAASLYAADMKKSHEAFKAVGEEAIKAELDTLNGRLGEHRALQLKQSDLVARVSHVQRDNSLCEAELARLRAEARQIKEHHDQAPKNVGSACRTCGKPHTKDDLKVVQGNLMDDLKRVALTIRQHTERLEQLAQGLADAVRARDAHAATIPDVTAVSARVAELNAKLREANQHRNAIMLLKKDYDAAQAAADRALTETNPYTAAVEAAGKQVEAIAVDIGKTKADQATHEQELELAATVSKVFSPAGVRAHILDTVTPFLNDRTSEYLNALSDGAISAVWSTLGETAKGELREKFNIDVEHAKGGKSFGLLSGGEKRKVRLATMLALQDLVAARATKNINLWIGDEIDDALDPAGLERLMGILERKARERGTVLVISHNELTDWIDSLVTVTKRGGKSHVDGALSA
jgi:DNA repair exonuclease SbcCD ATPase subunit